MASRSRRRQDAERMKAKARRLYPHDKTGKAADHLAVCSCRSCGNPRRHEVGAGRLTIQELRQLQDIACLT